VHGANRLGGNSLLDTVVFGARCGRHAAARVKGMSQTVDTDTLNSALKTEEERFNKLRSNKGTENPYTIKNELSQVMMDNYGIFRNETDMKKGVEEVYAFKERFEHIRAIPDTGKFNFDFLWVTEIAGNIDAGLCIAKGALNRTESRGSHFRIDHSKRDDGQWLKHSMFTFRPEGPEISYKPVTMGKYKPEERKY
jgi:succinate dehydrogenase / fumarate reductase flavoprotein subunit